MRAFAWGFVGCLVAIVCIAFANNAMAEGIASLLSKAGLAFAAILGAITASRGLATWRRQLQGTAAFEAARRYLMRLTRFADELQAARSPFMSGAEMASAAQARGIEGQVGIQSLVSEKGKQFMKDATSAAYQLRFERLRDAYNEIYEASIEAEVLFGPSIREQVGALSRLLSSYRSALQIHLADQESEMQHQVRRKTDDVLFSMKAPGDVDQVNELVQQTIQTAHRLLSPHIRAALEHS